MLEVRNLHKRYASPQGELSILSGIDLDLPAGSAIAVMGPSGSGKSTLLYILGLLDTPTEGQIRVDGEMLTGLDESSAARFRNRHIGFVFQDHCLLPQLTLIENVLTPTLVGEKDPGAPERAGQLLERVGLSHRRDHRPGELSGGEKQRAAIARALIRSPKLLLCDEPTGNLDRRSSDAVADLLLEIHGDQPSVLVVVTHSAELADRLPRRYLLNDGRLARAA